MGHPTLHKLSEVASIAQDTDKMALSVAAMASLVGVQAYSGAGFMPTSRVASPSMSAADGMCATQPARLEASWFFTLSLLHLSAGMQRFCC